MYKIASWSPDSLGSSSRLFRPVSAWKPYWWDRSWCLSIIVRGNLRGWAKLALSLCQKHVCVHAHTHTHTHTHTLIVPLILAHTISSSHSIDPPPGGHEWRGRILAHQPLRTSLLYGLEQDTLPLPALLSSSVKWARQSSRNLVANLIGSSSCLGNQKVG